MRTAPRSGSSTTIERDWAERYGAERVAVMRELLEEMAGL